MLRLGKPSNELRNLKQQKNRINRYRSRSAIEHLDCGGMRVADILGVGLGFASAFNYSALLQYSHLEPVGPPAIPHGTPDHWFIISATQYFEVLEFCLSITTLGGEIFESPSVDCT